MRPHTGVRKLGVVVATLCMAVTPLALVLNVNLGQHAQQDAAQFIYEPRSCDGKDDNLFLRQTLTSLKTNDSDESEAIDRAIEFVSHFSRD